MKSQNPQQNCQEEGILLKFDLVLNNVIRVSNSGHMDSRSASKIHQCETLSGGKNGKAHLDMSFQERILVLHSQSLMPSASPTRKHVLYYYIRVIMALTRTQFGLRFTGPRARAGDSNEPEEDVEVNTKDALEDMHEDDPQDKIADDDAGEKS
uniref:Uncharacterized protein n=1 Tax=Cannabis sativa TaxID=3483 RepID=A0A803QHM8_CANSA